MRPQTYWTERLDASDARRHEQQLDIARGLIAAGLEMVFQITGSGLRALEETEAAASVFLAAHNPTIAAEIATLETQGTA
ncbi:hypothetical protein EOA60_03075 [Mesorhizobium sp. M1A.F.Ca.IN.020.06.1.1]|uniref:hypothetical protein n=1 Tax=unclassified Mesorhizobium TaxID=325217 RepID=UPI000FCB9B8E|nr:MULTISPECIES: hypothetical protein [unclassified Mesorhizobium]RUU99682.1 hypothetical protein EOA79_21530 [Mesorhizobium sp. M1A.F.Ca.IN.020.03.2.1]RUV88180.1 hypothetical protein EOA51_08175 [Mesorhizobium sp. M1A.F.Ca.IN.020.32.1.1]RUW04536.1 hypothetical protein EOA46_30750 [Mesorhizobium sp. M1A.F.Ca.IN.022.05.2.1]RUW36239.1 hypothetical protein EOA60_03075 [Mesorhizobium sp. M1A.F.Ca.IN.020.06.1.1]RWF82373.1 MAG: hypothetical protein EOQ35_10505 [Mesorhizobium sp.]